MRGGYPGRTRPTGIINWVAHGRADRGAKQGSLGHRLRCEVGIRVARGRLADNNGKGVGATDLDARWVSGSHTADRDNNRVALGRPMETRSKGDRRRRVRRGFPTIRGGPSNDPDPELSPIVLLFLGGLALNSPMANRARRSPFPTQRTAVFRHRVSANHTHTQPAKQYTTVANRPSALSRPDSPPLKSPRPSSGNPGSPLQPNGVPFATSLLSGPATHAHGQSLAHLHCRGCSHLCPPGAPPLWAPRSAVRKSVL